MGPKDILFHVANFNETTIDEVVKCRPSRKAHLKKVRHDYYWVAYLMSKKNILNASLMEIGEVLKQDHSTVLHAFKQVNNLIETEKQTRLQKQQLYEYVRFNVEFDYNAVANL